MKKLNKYYKKIKIESMLKISKIQRRIEKRLRSKERVDC